ncbi:hypothetical protein SDC9_61311 [bioreactor metagenome]|uniref:Uncharacterized protein n=1 Tax=bioreactor metagenome TaxID=1076179 RepID=A0A644XGB5_9ZZZZ
MLLGALEQPIAAPDIGRDGLLRIELLQRNMLIGGSVEQKLGPVLLHDTVDLRSVLDIAHHRHHQIAPLLLVVVQSQAQVMELGLIDIQKDQLGRTIAEKLAADLASDAPPCPGDQYPLVHDHLPDRLLVDADQRPAQQVGVVEIAQVKPLGALLHLKEGGDHLDVAPRLLGGIDSGKHPLLVNLGNGDDQGFCPALGENLVQIMHRPIHLDAQYQGSLELGIVISQADNVIEQLTLLVLADEGAAKLPSPIDDCTGKVGIVVLVTVGEYAAVAHPCPHKHGKAKPIGNQQK